MTKGSFASANKQMQNVCPRSYNFFGPAGQHQVATLVRKVSMTGGARDAGIVPDQQGGREGAKLPPARKVPVARCPFLGRLTFVGIPRSRVS